MSDICNLPCNYYPLIRGILRRFSKLRNSARFSTLESEIMQLVISNNDPVLTSVFRALAAHSSDPYRWLEVLRPALRWAESAADASEYSNQITPDEAVSVVWV